jgi:hypothetical protein
MVREDKLGETEAALTVVKARAEPGLICHLLI